MRSGSFTYFPSWIKPITLLVSRVTKHRVLLILTSFIFFLSFFPSSLPKKSAATTPLSGDRDITFFTIKRQGKGTTRILPVDILLCSRLPIVRSGAPLNNRTISIGHFPDFLFDNPRKRIKETVYWSRLLDTVHYELSFFLSVLFYRFNHSTFIIVHCKKKNQKKEKDFLAHGLQERYPYYGGFFHFPMVLRISLKKPGGVQTQ